MTELHEELLQIADRLDRVVERGKDPAITEPLRALRVAAEEVGQAFSGSWLGYHAYVYYAGLKPPPPGAHFSQEWGLKDVWPTHETRGDWREYESEEVKDAIRRLASNPDLSAAIKFNEESSCEFEVEKANITSIFETALGTRPDPFLSRLKAEVDQLSVLSELGVAEHLRPKGQRMTRDTVVLGQRTRVVPPHVSIKSEALAIENTIRVTERLGMLARQGGSHLSRRKRQRQRAETVGTNVFIGHGRSQTWRELKDFIEDRLGLPVDEFNRVPVAGLTNVMRLSEMLEAAAIAFLIMTGEDEQPDGKLRARMNVVHEAGLFQGRLGFARAIVLLETGCEGFSNIDGLGHIPFPKGNIKAAFEQIREVLEREGLLTPSS